MTFQLKPCQVCFTRNSILEEIFKTHWLVTQWPTGALPIGQNQPRKCPYSLYAESVTGTVFSSPRSYGAGNQRVWLYRIRPSIAIQKTFTKYDGNPHIASEFTAEAIGTYLIAFIGFCLLYLPLSPFFPTRPTNESKTTILESCGYTSKRKEGYWFRGWVTNDCRCWIATNALWIGISFIYC